MDNGGDEKTRLKDGFWVGDWLAEPMLNRVVKEEEQVQLEPKVMDVLEMMAERPGKTVTKEEFLNRVWADTVVTDDVLSRCISQLRKVFEDDARDPDYIETIRKTGYRLIAPVHVPDAEEVNRIDSATDERDAQASESDTSQDAGLAGTLRGLTDDLTLFASDSDAEKKWVVVAGGVFERRWVVITTALVLVAGIVVGIGAFFFPNILPASRVVSPVETVPLTSFTGLEVDPALSPDGRQVAFVWESDSLPHRNVYLMQEEADTPLRLTDVEANEWSPAWSPDGQHVAFVRTLDEGCGVFTVSSIGGSERQLAHFPDRNVQALTWSPDTSDQSLVLALQQPSRQTYSLYRLPVEADTLIQLTHPPAYSMGDMSPKFSPTGDRVAFTRTLLNGIQDVHVVAAEGGETTQVTSDSTRITGLDWTSDGEQIIFASDRGGTSGLWRVSTDGGEPEWITAASEGTQISYPSLARQGNRLVYAQQSGQMDIWKAQYLTEYTETSTERLISSTRWDSDPDIAPDGSRIAFVSERSGYPEIWIVTSDGTEHRQVTTFEARGTQTPRWSPDGRQLAFASRKQGRSDIYVVNEDGLRPRRITKAPAEDLLPAWSHDGEALYFTSNRSGTWEIWKIPVGGGAAVQVTQGGATAAQDHPDGSTLYFVRSDTTGLWAAPRTDTSRTITFGESASTAVSPDSLSGEAEATLRQVVADLMPYDRANWQVRDRGIYFLRRGSGSDALAFYRFSTEQVNSIFLLEDVPHEPGLAVAPEGDWLLYTRARLQDSDVLLVKDFQ